MQLLSTLLGWRLTPEVGDTAQLWGVCRKIQVAAGSWSSGTCLLSGVHDRHHPLADGPFCRMVARPYLDGWSAITKFSLRIAGIVFSFILLCVCIAYMAFVPAAVFGFFVALSGLGVGIFYLIVHWHPYVALSKLSARWNALGFNSGVYIALSVTPPCGGVQVLASKVLGPSRPDQLCRVGPSLPAAGHHLRSGGPWDCSGIRLPGNTGVGGDGCDSHRRCEQRAGAQEACRHGWDCAGASCGR